MKSLLSNQAFEGLIRIGPDGRPVPWLAKALKIADDRRSITLDLRPDAKFHDGSLASTSVLVQALRQALPQFAGPLFDDVSAIDAAPDGHQITVTFKRPAPLLVEALEAYITKPGSPAVGTGVFALPDASSPDEMRANADYYLGRPAIDRIVMKTYPSQRAAWAELLRNNLDVLYAVGPEAQSSMQDAKTISTFTFTRSYQYIVLLNVRSPMLRSPEVRRALNAGINRAELVRDGFDGRAVAATGMVWPQNWAFNPDVESATFDPQGAAATLHRVALKFKCLVPPDNERVALVVKRQLAAVGVEMAVEEVTSDRLQQAVGTGSFEAALFDPIFGPSLLRFYELWHTGGSTPLGPISSPQLDAAFDRIRYAASDDEYRKAVENLQRVTFQDPPAIYLAWGQRSHAISKRFDVPVDQGRDPLGTLRMWKPATMEQRASRN